MTRIVLTKLAVTVAVLSLSLTAFAAELQQLLRWPCCCCRFILRLGDSVRLAILCGLLFALAW